MIHGYCMSTLFDYSMSALLWSRQTVPLKNRNQCWTDYEVFLNIRYVKWFLIIAELAWFIMHVSAVADPNYWHCLYPGATVFCCLVDWTTNGLLKLQCRTANAAGLMCRNTPMVKWKPNSRAKMKWWMNWYALPRKSQIMMSVV